MKFGVFLPNASNGYILSRNSPLYLPSYAHLLSISQEAERQGLDFILSQAKFRGFGGETKFWDSCLESLTLMAALAAATSRVTLFPSVGILSLHPAIVARMVSTIDDVSGGRCGLNIVTGWNKPEYSQMGMWPGDAHFSDRYTYAEEYVTALRMLWGAGNATFKGKHFELDDCALQPKPRGSVPIVCAGSSPKGQRFTAQFADFSFTVGNTEAVRNSVFQLSELAGSQGREVGVYAQFTLIVADTDAEAKRHAEHIVDGADMEAITNLVASASMDTNAGGSAERSRAAVQQPIEQGNLVFMGGSPVIWGSPETVASKISDIVAETGVSGMIFSWPDYVEGVRVFGEKILPRLNLPPEAA